VSKHDTWDEIEEPVTKEEQAQYDEMQYFCDLSKQYEVCVGSLQVHAAIARGMTKPTRMRVDLDNFFRPGWKLMESRFVANLIDLRDLGLIEILKTYSFTDHEMIIYPFEHYARNIKKNVEVN
jgi:hypothetical protein